MKGQRIIITDLGNAPAAGGTPVSLQNSDGTEIGKFSHVIDAFHAQSLLGTGQDGIGEQPSGIRTDIATNPNLGGAYTSNPTSGPHPGTTATDAPDPFGYSDPYEMDPDLSGGAAGAIQVPLYDKGFSSPVTQHVTSDAAVPPMNIGNGASFNPDSYPNVDITVPPPIVHPRPVWPSDPNA